MFTFLSPICPQVFWSPCSNLGGELLDSCQKSFSEMTGNPWADHVTSNFNVCPWESHPASLRLRSSSSAVLGYHNKLCHPLGTPKYPGAPAECHRFLLSLFRRVSFSQGRLAPAVLLAHGRLAPKEAKIERVMGIGQPQTIASSSFYQVLLLLWTLGRQMTSSHLSSWPWL